jgi:hypothetical protein
MENYIISITIVFIIIIIIILVWSKINRLKKNINHQKSLVYVLRDRLGDKQDDSFTFSYKELKEIHKWSGKRILPEFRNPPPPPPKTNCHTPNIDNTTEPPKGFIYDTPIQKDKLIQLDENEKNIILICKGHKKDKYPFTGHWHSTLKPLCLELWGWEPNEDNNYCDYLRGMFHKLLDLHQKIKEDYSNDNRQLKEVFAAAFNKGLSNDANLPIERVINELCSLIQINRVVNDNGVKRYSLY